MPNNTINHEDTMKRDTNRKRTNRPRRNERKAERPFFTLTFSGREKLTACRTGRTI